MRLLKLTLRSNNQDCFLNAEYFMAAVPAKDQQIGSTVFLGQAGPGMALEVVELPGTIAKMLATPRGD